MPLVGPGGAVAGVRRRVAAVRRFAVSQYRTQAPATYAVSVPLLPRLVQGRSRSVWPRGLLPWSVTGCAQFNKALGQQQVIYFKTSTPVAFKLKVRAACDNLPHVKARRSPPGYRSPRRSTW